MAILKIKQPNGSWAIVGDTSETIKFTEQQLTEEQKQIARTNIGATSIIDVVKLPTENIREDVLYRWLTGTFYYDGVYKDTFVCEMVNALPDNG
jgi:hypothetical protein